MRRAISARRKRERRCSTSRRWSRKACSASFNDHDARHAVGVEHVEVERHAHFELGRAEQRFHQHARHRRCASWARAPGARLGRFVAHVGEQRQLLLLEQRGDALDQARFLHLIGDLGDDDLVGAARAAPRSPSARAGGSCRGRSHRPRTIDVARPRPARRRSGNPGRASARPAPRSSRARLAHEMRQRVAQLDDIVRRDAGRHADGDAGRRRWRGDWESAPAARPALRSRRHRSGGNRRRSRRCPAAAPRRRRSGGSRCSAWPRRYRRRYCRNCPARRPADSAARNPAPGAPARRRPRCRHADGTCR